MTSSAARTILQTDPVAKQLLASQSLARLAYIWHDGTPRIVPMWFHWTGETILLGAPPNAPTMGPLLHRPEVALTIDTEDWPYQVLSVRGRAQVELVDCVYREYVKMARRYLGEAGAAQQLALREQTSSHWARITIHPEAVRTLDSGAGQLPSAWSVGLSGDTGWPDILSSD